MRKAFILTGEKHFNPLPPYGGRPTAKPQHFFRSGISIHSLRMEGDNRIKHKPHLGIIISIHSLRMEGDNVCDCPVCIHCISIHSLRMEGDVPVVETVVVPENISIHSLRMEGDN